MAININTKELRTLLESTPASHNIMLSGRTAAERVLP